MCQARIEMCVVALLLNICHLFSLIHFADGGCPDSWSYFQGSCYHLVKTKVTWVDANYLCKEYQAHLTEIGSPEEDQFLKTFIHDNNAVDNMWIGLSDILTENEWIWTETPTGAVFSGWPSGYPQANRYKRCVKFDKNCHDEHHFICEKSEKTIYLIG